MLIKYISVTGRETIASVVSVEFDPVAGELIGYGQTGSLRYVDGRAFVMNDDGKTISVYHLQPKKQLVVGSTIGVGHDRSDDRSRRSG